MGIVLPTMVLAQKNKPKFPTDTTQKAKPIPMLSKPQQLKTKPPVPKNPDEQKDLVGCPCERENPVTGEMMKGRWRRVENMHTGEETIECSTLDLGY